MRSSNSVRSTGIVVHLTVFSILMSLRSVWDMMADVTTDGGEDYCAVLLNRHSNTDRQRVVWSVSMRSQSREKEKDERK